MNMLARWTSAALLVAAALMSGGLAWAKLAQFDQPEAVLRVMPWHPVALLEVAEASRSDGQVPTRDLVIAGRQMLRMAPLLDAPLVYLGFDKAAAGDREAASEAFLAAATRQPRNIPALSWLATEAARARDYQRVVLVLDQLSRIDPGRKDQYADALASIMADPMGADVFARALDEDSPLALAATEKLISVSRDMDFLMRAASQSPRFRQRLIDRIVNERGLESAFVAWLAFLPGTEAENLAWPFDPAFVGLDAPAPFNWQVLSDAERLKEGGLLVRYAGRGKPTFLKQVMLLGPGSYRLAAEMDGELSATGGGFRWRLKCLPGENELATVPVSSLARTLSAQSATFEVPGSGCPTQMLSLEGAPGALTTRARATVRRVTIRPIETGDR
jgi:hypothetical protein